MTAKPSNSQPATTEPRQPYDGSVSAQFTHKTAAVWSRELVDVERDIEKFRAGIGGPRP